MQHSSFQFNTIQYNTIQHSTIQYNTIQYNTTQYNTIQYNTVQYNTIQYNTIQYNTIQYDIVNYNTIEGNTTWLGTRKHKIRNQFVRSISVGILRLSKDNRTVAVTYRGDLRNFCEWWGNSPICQFPARRVSSTSIFERNAKNIFKLFYGYVRK